MLIKVGTLMTFETGEWSDFTYIGPFRVLCDFDQQEVIDTFKADWTAARVRLDANFRQSLDDVAQLRVPSRAGSVSLMTLADIKMNGGLQQIDRLDRMRNVTFEIELGKRLIGDVSKEAKALPTMKKLPLSVSLIESGDAQRMTELFGSFATAMMIGVLCIYVVLVLLFHDFLQPVTILGALPLSLGGAFLALLVTHSSFSMPTVIGLLMLMGVVTKNSFC